LGHTRFWAKETNFASFMPQSHAAAPKNRQRPDKQSKNLCNKKPGKCRAFQFSVTSYCCRHGRDQHRLCEHRKYLYLRQSLR